MAGDATTIVDLAGAVGGAGETGLAGAGDINIISKNTDAFIGEDPNRHAAGGRDAGASRGGANGRHHDRGGRRRRRCPECPERLLARRGSGDRRREVGAAGTISVDTALGSTLAAIATNDQVTARGNVAVVAGNTGEVDRLIGSAGLAGEVGLRRGAWSRRHRADHSGGDRRRRDGRRAGRNKSADRDRRLHRNLRQSARRRARRGASRDDQRIRPVRPTRDRQHAHDGQRGLRRRRVAVHFGSTGAAEHSDAAGRDRRRDRRAGLAHGDGGRPRDRRRSRARALRANVPIVIT